VLVEIAKAQAIGAAGQSSFGFRGESVQRLLIGGIQTTTNINFRDVDITVLIGSTMVVPTIPWTALSLLYANENGVFGLIPGDQTVLQALQIDLGSWPIDQDEELTVIILNGDAEAANFDIYAHANGNETAMPLRYFHSTSGSFAVPNLLRLYAYKDDGSLQGATLDYSVKGDGMSAEVDVKGASILAQSMQSGADSAEDYLAEIVDFGGTPYDVHVNIAGTPEESIAVMLEDVGIEKIERMTEKIANRQFGLTEKQMQGRELVHEQFVE